MSPISIDLRERVVAAVEELGLSIPETATLYNVGRTFVKKMLRLSREGADLAPRHGGGTEPLLKEKERAFLRKEISKKPDATLAELQEKLSARCGVEASLPTICRALKQLNLPRKKKPDLSGA